MNPALDSVMSSITALPDKEAFALLDWLEDYVQGMKHEED
jgi:hypothetical protein